MSNKRAKTDAMLAELLKAAATIAVVGCSPRTTRASNRIARYLLDVGYEVVPVNPFHSQILGLTCYPALHTIPTQAGIDIVNVFRNPRHTEGVVRAVAQLDNAGSRVPAVWTQLGVSSEGARQAASQHGILYVHNRCIMVEHSRLLDSRVR